MARAGTPGCTLGSGGQALVEQMVVLTSDHAFKKYPVEIGWVRTLEAVPQTGKPPILQAAFRILRNR